MFRTPNLVSQKFRKCFSLLSLRLSDCLLKCASPSRWSADTRNRLSAGPTVRRFPVERDLPAVDGQFGPTNGFVQPFARLGRLIAICVSLIRILRVGAICPSSLWGLRYFFGAAGLPLLGAYVICFDPAFWAYRGIR